MPSLCKEFIVIRHNIGHSIVHICLIMYKLLGKSTFIWQFILKMKVKIVSIFIYLRVSYHVKNLFWTLLKKSILFSNMIKDPQPNKIFSGIISFQLIGRLWWKFNFRHNKKCTAQQTQLNLLRLTKFTVIKVISRALFSV